MFVVVGALTVLAAVVFMLVLDLAEKLDFATFAGAMIAMLVVCGGQFLGSGAILTDRRIVHRRGLFHRPEVIPLETLARVDIAYGQLVITDTLGKRHWLSHATNINEFADAIVRRTRVPSSPILTGKLKVWNILFQTVFVAGFLCGAWAFYGTCLLIAGFGLDLKGLTGGNLGLFGIVLAGVIFATGVIATILSSAVIATILSPLILRIGLDAGEFRTLFDHYMPARIPPNEGFNLTFHFRAARRFASVLYGERI